MSDLLGGAFVPSFDNPLEMLLACHGKIQTQCATLRKLLQHLSSHGCDSQARQAAQAILRYFDTAGQNHHDDEEQDLFPRLLATTPNVEVHELIARLLDEHNVLDTTWQQLRPLLLAIAEGRAVELDNKSVEHFIVVHERHISQENAQLLPQAARLLDHIQLEALGRSMSARRGVVFSNTCRP